MERGLERYRQRALIEKLQNSGAQVFIATHSPAAIAAASQASLWYVGHQGEIGPLETTKTAVIRSPIPTPSFLDCPSSLRARLKWAL